MLAEIITIGDEILIGQVVDSNATLIAAELTKIGVNVLRISSISDDEEQILNVLKTAQTTSNIVIVTGGLGPTKDDITKKTACKYFEDQLVEDKSVIENIKDLFRKYQLNLPMEINLRQAMVPSTAEIFMNKHGTAPGMWMQKEDVAFVFLPGVPYEMEHLLRGAVIPKIIKTYKRPYIHYLTLVTYGMGESAVAEKIKNFEENLPDDIKLGYLPSLGKVRLRLSCVGIDKKEVQEKVRYAMTELQDILSDISVGLEEETSIVQRIGKILKSKSKFLSVAESCTGGRIAAEITKNPGASSFFKGSVTPYETGLKTKILGVPQHLIATYNVVSVQVAEAMAIRSCRVLGSDYAIATTGIAGPDKGEGDKEIGTVCIAIATPDGVVSEQFNFGNHRYRVIEKSVNKAFEMLLKEILKN